MNALFFVIYVKDWNKDCDYSAVRLSKHPFLSVYLKSWIRLLVVFKYVMMMNTKNQICLSQVQTDLQNTKTGRYLTALFPQGEMSTYSFDFPELFWMSLKDGIKCLLKRPISLSVQWFFSEALSHLSAMEAEFLNHMRVASVACFIFALYKDRKSVV